MTHAHVNEDKFRFYPTNSVTGHFANFEDADAALNELKTVGYGEEQFDILCGPEGALALDRTGQHHGLAAQLVRFAQQLSDLEHPLMQRYEEALNAGHIAVAVKVEGNQEKIDQVHQIFKSHHGHDIVFYGKNAVHKLEL
jgi:hypothetical protein